MNPPEPLTPPEAGPHAAPAPSPAATPEVGREPASRLADAALVAAFLALAGVLAAFPLNDGDFWWHLRTGDWIRANGRVPRTDLFTFTVPDHAWIDLHWGYQVALSWGFEHLGLEGLNLAKVAVVVATMAVVVSTRRRGWPLWVMLPVWLPAMILLSWRWSLRPETLSELYLALTLAIVFRWERRPALAWLLPPLMVVWVNTQGIFVLGLAVIGLGTVDAALRLRSGRWWGIAAPAVVLSGLACLANPYGLEGALYPSALAGTLSERAFRENILEFTPLPLFVERSLGRHVMLAMAAATAALAVLSFALPMAWRIAAGKGEPSWRCSTWRLLLVVVFGALGWHAVRNLCPFAMVAGSVASWNLGEWAAAVRGRLEARRGRPLRAGPLPRLAALAMVVGVLGFVGGGGLYRAMHNGRTVGLGEQAFLFPHEAVRFAGTEGMPARFVGFPLDLNALYIYHHGPGRKVFADPRLEVVGIELFRSYLSLEMQLAAGDGRWARDLAVLGGPAVMIAHDEVLGVGGKRFQPGASLLAHPAWKCAWFDARTALYVPRLTPVREVDLGARHFRPEGPEVPDDPESLLAGANGLASYAWSLQARRRPELAGLLVLLGLDHARRLRELEPDRDEPWGLIGMFELNRDPAATSAPRRPGRPFDPVADLPVARAAFALRRAARPGSTERFSALGGLLQIALTQGMTEAAAARLDELLALRPENLDQEAMQRRARSERTRIGGSLGQMPVAPDDPNALLESGRALSAIEVLQRRFDEQGHPWSVGDRLATLLLRLGEADRAREVWRAAKQIPSRALRTARVAAAQLAGGDELAAWRSYQEATAADPSLFEAQYGLAVLAQDQGDAGAALDAAEAAAAHAPDEARRDAARAIADRVRPYAGR